MTAPERLEGEAGRFLNQPGLQAVFDALERAGGVARVAGGAVRNALLGQPAGDVDLSTTLLPDHVLAALKEADIKAVPTGIDHGTVTAVAGKHPYEITTLRQDVETHGRHATVRFGTDWVEDARRRDFTMNALYCDRHGKIHDPLDGYDDLVNRRVRFIGDGAMRIAEDHLRILRFFRFFAWYGQGRPDADSLKACAAARERIGSLSAERVWNEIKKLLAASDPSRALLWMRTSGILGETLPESAKWGIDAIAGLVELEVEFGLRPDPLLRLMSILPPDSARVGQLAARLKLSNAEADRLRRFAQAVMVAEGVDEGALRQALYASEADGLRDRLVVETARVVAFEPDGKRAAALRRLLPTALEWRRPQFPLTGQDLIKAGFVSGPALGAELKRLESLWAEGGFASSAADLLEQARKPEARK
jgi:poly(A) polymerase